MRDLERCATHERVKLMPPAAFPIDGLHALHAALVAQERGVFGVPTFCVGDEMMWGHDRLPYVARAAAA